MPRFYAYHNASGNIVMHGFDDGTVPLQDKIGDLSLFLLDGPLEGEWHVADGALAPGRIDDTPIEEVRAAKWEAIKTARDAAETASTFESQGSVFDSDPTRIGGAAMGAQIALARGLDFTLEWTLADNSVRSMTAQEVMVLGLAQVAHIDRIHQTSRTLRAAIEQAQTRSEVEAITWPQDLSK